MNRHLWLVLLTALPSLAGCTPPGPPEHYRSALQARSEFVDSLSQVVDEKTAKEKFKVSEKLLNDRLSDVREGLERVKFPGAFDRLRRENFVLKNMDPGDRAAMIDGMKAYLLYCSNIVYTNVRLEREIRRLRMVAKIEALNKARTQLDNKQPLAVDAANDFPNLTQMFTSLETLNNINLRFVPAGIGKKELEKLESGLTDSELETIVTFDVQKLDVKVPGLEPPLLPKYPAWANDVNTRAKLGFNLKN